MMEPIEPTDACEINFQLQLSQLLLTIVRSLENPADGSDRTSKLIRIQLTRLSPRRETGGGLPMTGRLSW